jgi:hypothetical protein
MKEVAPPSYHLAISRRGHAGLSQPDRLARDAPQRLAPGVGLILALLLSLGIWGVIWFVGSTLAALWPG